MDGELNRDRPNLLLGLKRATFCVEHLLAFPSKRIRPCLQHPLPRSPWPRSFTHSANTKPSCEKRSVDCAIASRSCSGQWRAMLPRNRKRRPAIRRQGTVPLAGIYVLDYGFSAYPDPAEARCRQYHIVLSSIASRHSGCWYKCSNAASNASAYGFSPSSTNEPKMREILR